MKSQKPLYFLWKAPIPCHKALGRILTTTNQDSQNVRMLWRKREKLGVINSNSCCSEKKKGPYYRKVISIEKEFILQEVYYLFWYYFD